MKCRCCGEELMDGVIVCPGCGTHNPLPKKRSWIPIIAAVCCVVLVIGIAAVAIGMTAFPETQTETITDKACYTESDSIVKAKANTVVAKAGDFTLTNGELQVLYWSMVYDFLDYMGSYAAYYIDFTQPLSGQYYNQDQGITWEHYFLNMALNTWRRYEALSYNAAQEGVELDAELQDRLDHMYENMESALEDLDFDTVEELVRHDFGAAATFEDYMAYMDIYYHGNNYYNLMYLNMEITEDDIEAYYTENESALVDAGYGKDAGKVVEVRHILIAPEDDSDEKSWDEAKKTAQDLMDQWVKDGAQEEDFAELAKQYSSCGSASNGGLLDPFTKGQMVEPFENWSFADGHQYGDYGLVQTEFGWHILFFVDSYDLWREAVLSNLRSENLYAAMTEMENEFPMVVAYSRIVLADVPLT